LIYMVPVTIGGTIGIVTAAITRQSELNEKAEKVKDSVNKVIDEADEDNDEDTADVNIGGGAIQIKTSKSDDLSPEEKYAKRLKNVRRETLTQFLMHIFLTPILILISSLSFVITALLYIKTRLAGGESMQDLLSKFEDADSRKTTKWQNRIRERLQQSGRITSKT
jgi:hypothetical protein